jgi:hypothetical protein
MNETIPASPSSCTAAKCSFLAAVLALFAWSSIIGMPATVRAATCTPTGFVRDSINMTAARVNPPASVSGDLDASGCNIGVYFSTSGSVTNAAIHGANYFGVVVNGDVGNVSVDVTNTSVHDIGNTPFDGTQHGVAIYYRAFGSGTATGKIWSNTITAYQKGGIVANGAGTRVSIHDNTVTGLGHVPFIAQNGIQAGFGVDADILRNTVTGNSYTGLNDAVSGGILVVGGACNGGDYTTGTQVEGNTIVNNDVGVFLSNLDGSCTPPATATNIKAINNTISSDAFVNRCCSTDGLIGYQAGVSDQGNNDKVINNAISGPGYDAALHPNAAFSVDASAQTPTNRAKVHANSYAP